jgi:putative ABC transport system permease protein
MILAIGTGLGLFMTMNTMAHQTSKVPLKHISQKLFMVQLDNRELSADDITLQQDMISMTYQDVQNLYAQQTPAQAQTYAWNSSGVVNIQNSNIKPFRASLSATTHDFFEMFEAPFLYGSGWSAQADQNGLANIVLTKKTNNMLFGGENSVGKTVRIGTDELVVIGVLDDWFLSAKFYDGSFYTAFPDHAFIPSRFAFNANFPRQAYFNCPSDEKSPGRFGASNLAELKTSECGWISFWARINSTIGVDEYKDTLSQYVVQQKQLGRFPRAENNFLTNINEQAEQILGGDQWLNILKIVGALFFIVCLINAISILLAKFMRRVKEVSLRRALGAKRKTLMQQYIIEVCMIGSVGGVVGVAFAFIGLEIMMQFQLYGVDYVILRSELEPYYKMDWPMIGTTFLIALISSLIVGLYPIWRICTITPASQLKAQ